MKILHNGYLIVFLEDALLDVYDGYWRVSSQVQLITISGGSKGIVSKARVGHSVLIGMNSITGSIEEKIFRKATPPPDPRMQMYVDNRSRLCSYQGWLVAHALGRGLLGGGIATT